MEKKTIVSGIQSSGNLTLGNYIGSIRNWLDMQEEYNSIFMIADMHSLTVRRTAEELRENKRKLIAIYLACGLDPNKAIIFEQSKVPAHSEVNWILNCYTYMGELSRMTQYKDKSLKHSDNINSGLFTYPVLMAADILIYSPDFVPVGEDQKQHVELTRNLAQRFNNIYGETFVVPKEEIREGARIMGLQNPESKMSKSSENENDSIYILDNDEDIKRKIKKAVTDSENKIYYDVINKKGISNLLTIYACLKNIKIKDAEKYFENKNYGELKKELIELLINVITPIREKYYKIYNDEEYINKVLEDGRKKANNIAENKKIEIYKKVGLI